MAPPSLPPLSPVGPQPGPPVQNPPSSSGMRVAYARGDNTGVGAGPGPLRHPRPLTASELHMQVEKEQEGVAVQVNRLQRELSQLRAQQSASVASTASSTSRGLPDTQDSSIGSHSFSGPTHPATSQRRHHRSSSSTSSRSITTPDGSSAGWSTAGITGSIPSGAAVQIPADRAHRGSPTRQNSMTSSRRSGASSPAISSARSSFQQGDPFPVYHPHRQSITSLHPSTQHAVSGSPSQTLSPDQATASSSLTGVATTRYEETAQHRGELEAVKRENDSLRRRIRELERLVSSRRPSAAGSDRSTSAGTRPSIGRRDTAESEPSRDHEGEKASEGGARENT
ncbi:MAG: hypothetical protein M1837_001998 [Sclerophora amabilis]|nr:MAG: hypothetical protein M1837_001998 [Sclerophora amabilis]